MIHIFKEARKGRYKERKLTEEVAEEFAAVEKTSVTEEQKLQKEQLTIDDITGQALIFFFASFDSVFTVSSFMAHELAVNSDVQQRLQNEIIDSLNDYKGSITYEALMKTKYMYMIISETLRKWSRGLIIDRVCFKPYTIQPVKDREKLVHFKKDDVIWFLLSGLDMNPQYFSEPEKSYI